MTLTPKCRYRVTIMFADDSLPAHHNLDCLAECSELAGRHQAQGNVAVIYDRQEREFVS